MKAMISVLVLGSLAAACGPANDSSVSAATTQDKVTILRDALGSMTLSYQVEPKAASHILGSDKVDAYTRGKVSIIVDSKKSHLFMSFVQLVNGNVPPIAIDGVNFFNIKLKCEDTRDEKMLCAADLPDLALGTGHFDDGKAVAYSINLTLTSQDDALGTKPLAMYTFPR